MYLFKKQDSMIAKEIFPVDDITYNSIVQTIFKKKTTV
jgi:hypothetical protein